MMYMQYRRELNVIIVKDRDFMVEFIFGSQKDLKAIQYCWRDNEKPKDSWPLADISESKMGVNKSDLVRFLFNEELGEVFSFKAVK